MKPPLGLALLLLPLLLAAATSAAGARRKRLVAFRNGSTYFYKLNYKVTTLNSTTLFAWASGFKVAWELPNGRPRIGRSIDDQPDAALLFDSHGFDGKMCLVKSLCQAMQYIKEKDGILMKIFYLLFGSSYSRGNATSASLDPLVCGNYANHCPLHLMSLDPFAEH